ncbi:MerR family DNA-binding transcriptional regulator [Streptosporangium sp. NPDC002607]
MIEAHRSGARVRPAHQAARNYEEAGILPPAERSPHGYRLYAPRHSAALRTFLALIPRTVTRTVTRKRPRRRPEQHDSAGKHVKAAVHANPYSEPR